MALPDWLQAGAATVQAGVAVALYRITRKYVELTGRLAVASESQVEFLRAERDEVRSANLKQLGLLSQALLASIRSLPGPGTEARQRADSMIRGATLPSDEQLDELRKAAAQVGPASASLALSTTSNYSWLLRWAREVQATSTSTGYDYEKIPWRMWVFHWIEAEQALTRLSSG